MDQNVMKMAHSLFTTVDYPTLSSHKEEETEGQSGGNGTNMVLPLNDTLNGPKRDEYGALSSQPFVDYRTPSCTKMMKRNPKEEETEAQIGGNVTKMVLPLNDALNEQNVMKMVHSLC